MDLHVPDHIRPTVDRYRRFMEERIYPREHVLDQDWFKNPEANAVMQDLRAQAKAEGMWAAGLPREIGGGGMPWMDYVYLTEVTGRSEHAVWVFGLHSFNDAIMLHLNASAEWRDKYLAPLVDGQVIQSFGMTEPEVASSDPTQLRTTAVLDGDEWVINGRKWFTTQAHVARYTVVMARTEPDAPDRDAFSMIVVPTDTPGYTIVREVPVLGMWEGDHCEVVYDDVRVPASNLLGERGQGFTIAQQRLGPGRITHCMRWLGQAQRAFDLMCERAVRRVAFGSTLAEKQLVQKMVFDTAAEIRAARMLTLEAARRLDEGDLARVDIGIIKVVGAAMLHNAIDRAIQVHGAAGVTDDFPLSRMYRHARLARIYDGPDETHVANVARLLLKPYRAAAAEQHAED